MKRKIAISGSHSTGKTFLLYELAKKYKLKYPNKEISIVSEVSRKCPYPINENTPLESQYWMFSTQIKMEMDATKETDIVICDRSIADHLAYAKLVSNGLYESMIPFVKEYIKTYDKIFFKTIKNNDYLIDDGVRSTDPIFRQVVEDNLKHLYNNILINDINEMISI